MNQNTDYIEAVMAVKDMERSKGWAIYCEEFNQRFEKLTNTVLDGTTEPVTAERLRQARSRIEQEFTPAIIMGQLLTKTEARAEAQLRATGLRPEKQT